MTRDADFTPGVDHDQLLSISTEKARYAEATPDGINTQPLMPCAGDLQNAVHAKRRLAPREGDALLRHLGGHAESRFGIFLWLSAH
ncbi:hypothetical protein [Parvibaculum sp.]|uniref:hypothetical protein n=1 Tax=Parvibaculum sp. TaxID=2024848 RepID=UPI00272EEC01|nr:hypothetical protein [Parvibaculum sp.]MDP1627586.1 hypothetical protein [Parvibaculum sp.]MDP2148765.1 hypothetical protein [Parvibaculum sp.]MDP3328711.1 hypothetical protein [Parvibaculum sp.]